MWPHEGKEMLKVTVVVVVAGMQLEWYGIVEFNVPLDIL